jgi:hypothetical protein
MKSLRLPAAAPSRQMNFLFDLTTVGRKGVLPTSLKLQDISPTAYRSDGSDYESGGQGYERSRRNCFACE